MLKKRVIDSLTAFSARISAYSPLTKVAVLMVLASLVIGIGYGVRTIMNKGQIAEIDIPVTAPVSPPPSYGINIHTPSVALQASNIHVLINDQVVRSYYELPTFINPFSTNSVTDPNQTTLEAFWTDDGHSFHAYLYFEAYDIPGYPRQWRLTNMQVLYDSTTWLTLNSNIAELYAARPIGQWHYLPSVDLTATDNNTLIIRILDLNLQAFINEIGSSPYPSPSPSVTTLCHAQEPVVSITPNNQNGYPGQTLTYNVAVTNTDSEVCGPSNFGFGTMTDPPFTADPIITSNYIPAGGTLYTTFTATSPSTNPWNEQRSVPLSFAATNFTSHLNSSSIASYTLLMPTPQTFDMYFKLAGVTGDGADGAEVSVKFYLKDGTVRALSEPLTLSYGSDGVYHTSATISNPFPAGTEFRLKVKGEKHIAIEYCKASGQTGPCGDNDYIVIPSNQQSSYMLSLVGIPLPPGDLSPQDGKANIDDLNKLKPLMGKLQSSLTAADLLVGDVNYDNFINIYDVFLILKTVETRYDD